MSGLEIALPIIATVAAIISAYKDGGTILNKLKDRRQKRGALPPTESLQQAFQRGAQEVAQARADIEERFGQEFRADTRTARALKDVTISLQDTIIRQLSAAQDDDDMNDFSPCLNEAVKARKQTVALLNELYLSLDNAQQQSLHIGFNPEQNFSRQATQTFSGNLEAGFNPERNFSRQTTQTFNSNAEAGFNQGKSFSRQTTQTFGGNVEPGFHPERNFSRQSTQRFDNNNPHGQVIHETSPTGEISTSPPQSRSRTHSWGLRFGRKQHSIGKTSPERVSTATLSPPIPAMINSGSQSPSPVSPVPISPIPFSRPSVAPSPEFSRLSMAQSVPRSPIIVNEPTPISETNNYRGLCKGAWKAQRLELRDAMKSSIKGYDRSYHCNYCKFSLPADTWNRESPCFDDRIKVSGQVYFRPLFLFKSHVKTKEKPQPYKCMFCLLAGEESSIYVSMEHFFEHIASHRGTRYRSFDLDGPTEITPVAVVPAHISDFDISFKSRRRQSTNSFDMLPESALGSSPGRLHELDVQPEYNPWR